MFLNYILDVQNITIFIQPISLDLYICLQTVGGRRRRASEEVSEEKVDPAIIKCDADRKEAEDLAAGDSASGVVGQ